ncbi:MAG: hypothetical protein AB2807_09035 [Candidatus Sedimenticola endophacoides]
MSQNLSRGSDTLVAQLLPESAYEQMCRVVSLEEVPEAAAQIMRGEVRGRVLVDPNR